MARLVFFAVTTQYLAPQISAGVFVETCGYTPFFKLVNNFFTRTIPAYDEGVSKRP